jgi:predicted membrane channel-forming protein YqfA (hemolysin III family)
MIKLARHSVVTIVMVASALPIVVIGIAFHIRSSFIVISSLAVLLGAAYHWKQSNFPRNLNGGHRFIIESGIIFLGGSIYGLVQSCREGWKWVDILSIIVPFTLGSYLIWFAIGHRSKTGR